MYLVAIAWLYVVVMMALAEALSPQGSLLGAFFTLLLYGVLPLAVALYILGAPHRRRARQAAERAERAERAGPVVTPAPDPAHGSDPGVDGRHASVRPPSGPAAPDGGGEAPGDAVAAVRKET